MSHKVEPAATSEDTSDHSSDSSINSEKALRILNRQPCIRRASPPRQIVGVEGLSLPNGDVQETTAKRRKKTAIQQKRTDDFDHYSRPRTLMPRSTGSLRGFVLLTASLAIALLTLYAAGMSARDMMHHQITLAKIQAGLPDLSDVPAKSETDGSSLFEVGGDVAVHHDPANRRRNGMREIIASGHFGVEKASPPLFSVKWGWESRTNISNSPSLSELDTAALGSDTSSAWCSLEMLPFGFVNSSSTLSCVADRPLRAGTFAAPSDLMLHEQFPLVDVKRELDSATAADLQAYWKDYPKGLLPTCYPCRGTLVHRALYTLRRWFRIERWYVEDLLAGSNAFVVDQGFLVTFRLPGDVFASPVEDESPAIQIPLNKIVSIHLVQAHKRASMWFITIVTSFGSHHTVELQAPALRSLLRTLTYLHPQLVRLVRVLDPNGALEALHRSKGGNATMRPSIPNATGGSKLEPDEVDDSYSGGKGPAAGVPADPLSPFVDVELPSKPLSALKLVQSKGKEAVWKGGILEGVLTPGPAEPWPYLPCSVFNLAKQQKSVEQMHVFGEPQSWPRTCNRIRESKCGQEDDIRRRRVGLEKVPLRVAVALSGFIRSFARARHAIYSNVVGPNQATVFVATYNVIGRVKKGEPVQKKQLFPLAHVMEKLGEWMQLSPTANVSEFVAVLNYRQQHDRMSHNLLHGFANAGMYICQSKVLELVREFQPHGNFDVIIRSRMDIFPVAPLVVTRVWRKPFDRIAAESADLAVALEQQALRGEALTLSSQIMSRVEYVLNMGASCKLDQIWWPQYATFSEGKLLKSYQDTRFNLFGWQVCDWVEIGTANTVLQLEGLYQFATDNYVFGAAQWIDHAFYVHMRIAYQIVNPFVKVMRHGGMYFG